MNDKNLAKKLTWIVLLKLAVIYLLWWVFISDQKMEVTADSMAQAIAKQGEPQHGQ